MEGHRTRVAAIALARGLSVGALVLWANFAGVWWFEHVGESIPRSCEEAVHALAKSRAGIHAFACCLDVPASLDRLLAYPHKLVAV